MKAPVCNSDSQLVALNSINSRAAGGRGGTQEHTRPLPPRLSPLAQALARLLATTAYTHSLRHTWAMLLWQRATNERERKRRKKEAFHGQKFLSGV